MPDLFAIPFVDDEDSDDTLYIIDTGAGAHLSQWLANGKLRPNKKTINFITANGRVPSKGFYVKMLKLIGETHFQVLDNTPNVLSVGRLVRENKIGFHWPIGGLPYLETANGDRVELKVINDVPYFSGRSMKILLKSELTPSPDTLLNSIVKSSDAEQLAQHDLFPSSCNSDSITKFALAGTEKISVDCIDVGIQTEVIE